MKTSDQINDLAAALSKAQGELEHAKKDSDNPFFKSKYADLASCLDVARGPLSANGLSVVQTPSLLEGGYVRMTTRLFHASGQWIEGELDALPKDSGPQSVGSVCSYLRRYMLSAMVGISAEDDDGNAGQPAAVAVPAAVKKHEPKKRENIAKLDAAEKKNAETPQTAGDGNNDLRQANSKYSAAATKLMNWHGTPEQWETFKGKARLGFETMLADNFITPEQLKGLEQIVEARDQSFKKELAIA